MWCGLWCDVLSKSEPMLHQYEPGPLADNSEPVITLLVDKLWCPCTSGYLQSVTLSSKKSDFFFQIWTDLNVGGCKQTQVHLHPTIQSCKKLSMWPTWKTDKRTWLEAHVKGSYTYSGAKIRQRLLKGMVQFSSKGQLDNTLSCFECFHFKKGAHNTRPACAAKDPHPHAKL